MAHVMYKIVKIVFEIRLKCYEPLFLPNKVDIFIPFSFTIFLYI